MPRDPVSWQTEHGGPEGRPPRESAPEHEGAVRFEADGEVWLARIAGKGAGGTGATGLGLVEAVHFMREAEPDTPAREALIERGRFADLFESELIELWRESRAIVPAAPAAPPPHKRRR